MPSEVPTCCHLKADGTFCRAVAIKDEKFCYFHLRAQIFRTGPRQTPAEFAAHLPVLDSPANIQAAIDQTAHAVAGGAIDVRTASVLLRAIQLASANLSALALSQAASTQPAHPVPIVDQRPARAQSVSPSAHQVRPTAPPAATANVAVRPKSTPPPSPAAPPNPSPTAPLHAALPHASQNRTRGLTHLTC